MSLSKLFAVGSLVVAALVWECRIAQALIIVYTPGVGESATVAGDPPSNAASNCCASADGNLSTGRSGVNTWSGRSVLRFDDLATLHEEAVINSATLRLFRSNAPDVNDGQQRIYQLTSGFTVAGLDPTCCAGDVDNRDLWRLADGIAGTTAGTPFHTFTASPGYNNIDVTSIVQSWQANNWATAHGFGLVGVENLNQSGVTYAGAFSLNPLQLVLDVTLPPVPEPSTLGLMAAGIAALSLRRRALKR